MMTRPFIAAIYARVSTTDQNCEAQLVELREFAQRQGWTIVEEYRDVASGASNRRPALQQLLTEARSGKFECVLCWKLDRFGRSLVDCLNNLQLLESLRVRFIAVTQGIDTDERNPASRFLLQILGAAAEFERSLIRERTQAGRVRYRNDWEAGKVGRNVQSRSGRNLAPHRPKKIFDRERVVELRGQGLAIRDVARRMGIGVGTVARVLKTAFIKSPADLTANG